MTLKKQKKCIRKECMNHISEKYLWCGMKCKEQFLLEHYTPEPTVRMMQKKIREHNKNQKKAIKDWEKTGLTFTEYLLSMGDFRKVDISEVDEK